MGIPLVLTSKHAPWPEESFRQRASCDHSKQSFRSRDLNRDECQGVLRKLPTLSPTAYLKHFSLRLNILCDDF